MKQRILFGCIIFVLTSCGNNNHQADAYGNFEAREVIVSAQGNGQIIWFNIEEGMVLKPGDIVGLIDTSSWYYTKQQLIAQYASTNAQFSILKAQAGIQRQQIINLEKDKARIKNMMKDGAATQKQYDDIQGGIDMAQRQIDAVESQRSALHSQLHAIKAQIEQADDNISKCMITNPQEGIVLVKYSEAGEVAVTGKALYKVGDVNNMRLKAYVIETQLSSIKVGQKVNVSIDAPDKTLKTFEGEIIWISDKAEFTPKIIQTRDERVNLVYAIKISIKNDGAMKIGMPGEVRF
jgi:HlyD family secretion protein